MSETKQVRSTPEHFNVIMQMLETIQEVNKGKNDPVVFLDLEASNNKRPNGAVYVPLTKETGILLRIHNWHPNDRSIGYRDIFERYELAARYYASRWVFNQTGRRNEKSEDDYIKDLPDVNALIALGTLYERLVITKRWKITDKKIITKNPGMIFGVEMKLEHAVGTETCHVTMYQNGEFKINETTELPYQLPVSQIHAHSEIYNTIFNLGLKEETNAPVPDEA